MNIPINAIPPRGAEGLSPEELQELVELPLLETDEIPLESIWHRDEIALLIAVLSYYWRERDDFVVAGNTFVYYSSEQAKDIMRDPQGSTAYRGPDFFYVDGAPRDKPRQYWAVWREEWRYPNVIVELLSPTTEKVDRTVKKEIYERTFRTPEYFLYDPDDCTLAGWRLNARQRYRKIPLDRHGRAWSEQIGLALAPWKGRYLGKEANWLRFYDAHGQLVPVAEEAEKERAEAEKERAEAEKERAEAEKERAEAEKKRAEAAEAEVVRLKARLAKLEKKK